MRRIWLGSMVVGLWASSIALPALAQGKDPVAAEGLFRDARDAAKRGDFPAACPKFAESYRLDPAPGTLFNLADCEERIGKLASAWQHFQQVSQQLPAGDERVGVAKEHVATLEKRLPKLTIRLGSGAPDGTKVVRDGVELGAASLGSALPVDPGAHSVVVRAPGRKDQKTDIVLKEGQSESLTVSAGDKAEGGAAPEGGGSSSTPTLGYVLVGVGGTSLLVGTVTGLMVLGKKSTFNKECDADKYCTQEGIDAGSSGKSLSTISTITFGLGLVGVGAGVYLIVSNKDEKGAATAIQARPMLGGGTVGLARSF